MKAYYNEIDPYCAQWLRNLIAAGHIAPGDVDERSIVDVRPDDLAGYAQCHFFAGIGGWSLALRLAGWPDDRLVWTGSCPCQPFSSAGKGKAADDERHLWPAWFRLINACRPTVIFGEQVASAAVVGLAGAEASLCDGIPEEEPLLRVDSTCEGTGEEEGVGFRSGRLFNGDTEANRRRFVRSDGIASEFGGWPNLGQSFTGPRGPEGALSLLEHSHRLSRHQQCDGRLGRTETRSIGLGDFVGEEAEVRRIIATIAKEFGPSTEWPWLDLVQSDLEGAGYTFGTSVLPACGVGAPHIRQRLWFVGQSDGVQPEQPARAWPRPGKAQIGRSRGQPTGSSATGLVANAERRTTERWRYDLAETAREVESGAHQRQRLRDDARAGHEFGLMADAAGGGCEYVARLEGISGQEAARIALFELGADSDASPVADAQRLGAWEQWGRHDVAGATSGSGTEVWERERLRNDARAGHEFGPVADAGHDERPAWPARREHESESSISEGPGGDGQAGPWSDVVWLPCTDGRARPTKPGLFPLASRLPNRVAQLRAAGNSIVPQVAAEFIRSNVPKLSEAEKG